MGERDCRARFGNGELVVRVVLCGSVSCATGVT